MPKVDSAELSRWRALDAEVVVLAISDFAKRDPTFDPVKSMATSRWYVTARGREFELLLNGPKFFDARAQKGGGAVDLAMYLLSVNFINAAQHLRTKVL